MSFGRTLRLALPVLLALTPAAAQPEAVRIGRPLRLNEIPAPQQRSVSVLLVVAVVAAQSLLIALLLHERRGRVNAQLALEQQVAYERTLAGLTADASRIVPGQGIRVLEEAIARIGRFARARAVILNQHGDPHGGSPARLEWYADSNASESVVRHDAMFGEPELEIPLIAEGAWLGTLRLFNAHPAERWSRPDVSRLFAAAEMVASALARARAARALEETRRQIAHMGRVAVMGELAAAVSHELRQPLAAIRANAQTGMLLLSREPAEIDEARAVLNDIVADNVRAAAVIDNVRLLLRKEAVANRPVDINDVCREAARLLHGDAAIRGARIDLRLDASLPMVRGDPVQLQQVVINLVLNALDAMAATADREVAVSTRCDGDEIEIAVADNGPGLTPQVQQHLFESFFSTKEHGLGMGLVIVRSIMERHHGRIVATTRVSGGAEFRVHLPLSGRRSGAIDLRQLPSLPDDMELVHQ